MQLTHKYNGVAFTGWVLFGQKHRQKPQNQCLTGRRIMVNELSEYDCPKLRRNWKFVFRWTFPPPLTLSQLCASPTPHQPPLSMQIRLPMFFQIAISIIRHDPLSSTATSLQTHPKQYFLLRNIWFYKALADLLLVHIWLVLVNKLVNKMLILLNFISIFMITVFTSLGYIISSKIC